MTSIQLNPVGTLSQLSQFEVDKLKQSVDGELYNLFRNCCLAVLNSGVEEDNYEEMFEPYQDFSVNLIRRERGVKIELINPPAVAFVDGKLIKGVHEHLFAVLRDILHMADKYHFDEGEISESRQLTDIVFDMLRHAEVIKVGSDPNMVVCWGGHSIGEIEYTYTKKVGYQLGLREMNICTGCGPGAMKGPMKGAAIGHAKQRYSQGRYLGISEPSIIAAEPPNAIVNELVIMPDIEKRLEAFVRIAHAIVIFPGGVGTAEELLYLLGVMLHENNRKQVLPIILTGPVHCKEYFESIDKFVGATLGAEAQALYEIIIDDPEKVAQTIKRKQESVSAHRREKGDSYLFNWSLSIEPEFQKPFIPTHQSMQALNLHFTQPKAELAAALRQAFSGIVAGNVKAEGIKQIRQHGPFTINGDSKLMAMLDTLLESFVAQQRMKLPGSQYSPCYQVETL
ncbi:nucleotide 5'-monophosphate nucleosidase PpnN [Aliiglaciecola sp. LCG003]|uniref:nucleotide 5'-monophosphate nucleosidase PpnN n=1 Tax=Aliiglaciecola sp. LCG003 TaxID=3053655 RepID=UPI0025745B14|nr:nucleotide 5'-monophosphate nucleosidase PpnN [Aliiglaciecola sp. LCG003]WJG10417.1 nucleotide 5'-monophosphate nucleosidase PpnN [Aliiglaciecola sp. LCG003]